MLVESSSTTTQEGTSEVNGNSTRRVKVDTGGDGVVAHVGLHALGCYADVLGLGGALSAQIVPSGERLPVHDRGKVLVHAMLTLAGGGDAVADVEFLRSQPALFGPVPSDSTLYRTYRQIDAATLARLWGAFAEVRAKVWGRVDTGEPVVLDIDASLVEIHSEHKQGTAATYKGGYGFHPMFCFADATGEMLGALLRPGNAAANSAEDHLTVLDQAVGQLPAEIAAGHHDGDDPASVARRVMVRADSAGATRGFVAGCRARNIGFAVVARKNTNIHKAISHVRFDESCWQAATRPNGEARTDAKVCEITDLVDLSRWPSGTRLIVRREPLHPGAQQSLFPSLSFRYWGHYTDQAGDPVTLDQQMRAHAHVEDHIGRLKDAGLERFPFVDLDANRARLAIVAFAADLVRWFQLDCLDGPLATAEPKTLRWQLWHAPARFIRRARQHIVRILDNWPTADVLLRAYKRIALIT
ncbi:MAG TPA: IS1380 family transposase [Acidimicrobiia bacterium]